MKRAFDRLNLRPFERRLVVGVGAAVFLVLNLVFVWPHFGDRSRALADLRKARGVLEKFEQKIAQKPALLAKVKALEAEAEPVPPEDQAIQFLRAIQTQASKSGVNITGTSRQTARTNQFFIEQSQTLSIISDEPQLVDFLYHLGTGGSMIRVRGLSLAPDAPRQRLAGSVTLVASYQKTPPKPAPKPTPAPPAATASATTPPAKSPAAATPVPSAGQPAPAASGAEGTASRSARRPDRSNQPTAKRP